jgi:hypothetical protein
MPVAWISVSTKWDITSVQAALNVFISVIGTIGIWTFSRYWWQRGSQHIVQGNSNVPLSALFTLSSPGEGYDAVRVLRRRVFAKEHWSLLLQLLIVLLATLACMLAGPIAKVSLRDARTVQTQNIEVLKTSKGTGFIGNRLDANVEWNDTMQALDDAKFPYNQILDYLPEASEPWIYLAREWDPTWSAVCDYHDEELLSNVSATGNGTFMEPLDAFTVYRDTYDSAWFDTSKFRVQADTNFEQIYVEGQGMLIKDALFWILIQSEPTVDDRMYGNNATLQLSMSALHLQHFWLSPDEKDATQASLETWKPFGAVGNASFSRMECNFTRKPVVLDEEAIPWIWTNDTWSITFAYRTNWMTAVGERSSKNLTITMPTPETLFRFYQAYMISVNTWLSPPSKSRVSIWMDTVQVSTVVLVVLVLLALLEVWISVRYLWFIWRHKKQLSSMCIPDSRIEWMIHTAKLAAQGQEEEQEANGHAKAEKELTREDRDYFRQASFGNEVESDLIYPQLARVYTTSRTSFASSPHKDGQSRSRSRSRSERAKTRPARYLPRISVRSKTEDGSWCGSSRKVVDGDDIERKRQGLMRVATSVDAAVADENMLSPMMSNISSEGRSRTVPERRVSCSQLSFASIVPEHDVVTHSDVVSDTNPNS